jgi:hypothetical protein
MTVSNLFPMIESNFNSLWAVLGFKSNKSEFMKRYMDCNGWGKNIRLL